MGWRSRLSRNFRRCETPGGGALGRKPRFTDDLFIDAALEIVSTEGPSGLTMAAVARRVKAPVGSVYHRFPSKDVLVAELWVQTVESFQEGFLKLLKQGSGPAAAMYTPRWVRGHFNEARLLLFHRRDELITGDWPDKLADRAYRLAGQLERGLEEFTRGSLGEATEENLQRMLFALIDVPYAAVKRYLQAGELPPAIVDELVRDTYWAVIGEEK